jgi:hypothetical protein
MTDRGITRRTALGRGAAFAGALALRQLPRPGIGMLEERPTLVVLWLNGGPAGLFSSSGSFLRSGAFGVTPAKFATWETASTWMRNRLERSR